MPKFQFIKMDDEIEKITSSSPVRIAGKFKKYSNNLSSCSIKLFLVRLMLLSMFSCFCFFVYKLTLKKCLLEVNVFKSHRLLNEKNIHQINNLEISLNIEHSKYVHFKISDKDNKRWEVPKDLLNPEYFDNLDNKINNKDANNETLFKIDMYGIDDYSIGKNFGFDLYFENEEDNKKNIFYSFKSEKNFLFSDNLISFDSYLIYMVSVKEFMILN